MQIFVIDGKIFFTISNTTHDVDPSRMIYPQYWLNP